MAKVYYPPISFFFEVSIDGGQDGDSSFKEVSGLEVELELEEIQEGGNNNFKHRLPVRTRYRNLVLKRGLIRENTALHTWINKTLVEYNNLDKKIERKNVTIFLYNEKGAIMNEWFLANAFPVKWSFSNLNSQESALIVETLEFAFQWMATD